MTVPAVLQWKLSQQHKGPRTASFDSPSGLPYQAREESEARYTALRARQWHSFPNNPQAVRNSLLDGQCQTHWALGHQTHHKHPCSVGPREAVGAPQGCTGSIHRLEGIALAAAAGQRTGIAKVRSCHIGLWSRRWFCGRGVRARMWRLRLPPRLLLRRVRVGGVGMGDLYGRAVCLNASLE
jgi:hypothetical protein